MANSEEMKTVIELLVPRDGDSMQLMDQKFRAVVAYMESLSDELDALAPEGLSSFLCNWPRTHTGTRSPNTIDRWFSARFQS